MEKQQEKNLKTKPKVTQGTLWSLKPWMVTRREAKEHFSFTGFHWRENRPRQQFLNIHLRSCQRRNRNYLGGKEKVWQKSWHWSVVLLHCTEITVWNLILTVTCRTSGSPLMIPSFAGLRVSQLMSHSIFLQPLLMSICQTLTESWLQTAVQAKWRLPNTLTGLWRGASHSKFKYNFKRRYETLRDHIMTSNPALWYIQKTFSL